LDFYAETKSNLEALAEMYSEEYSKLDPEIRESIIDAKLYLEPEMVDKYIELYEKIADPEIKFEFLFSGTVSKNDAVLEKMMSLLEKPEIVKPQDQVYLFIYLYRNTKSREKVFSWLTSHWDYVKEMAGDKSLDYYPRLTANVIRKEAEFVAWKEFFEPMRKDPALKRTIEIGENEIKSRLKLIESDKRAVCAELKNLL